MAIWVGLPLVDIPRHIWTHSCFMPSFQLNLLSLPSSKFLFTPTVMVSFLMEPHLSLAFFALESLLLALQSPSANFVSLHLAFLVSLSKSLKPDLSWPTPTLSMAL